MGMQNTMAVMNLKVTNPELSWEEIHKPVDNEEDAKSFEMMIKDSKNMILDMYKERVFND